MCGIAGVFGACTASELQEMGQRMAHRGPDNVSMLSIDNVHLVHARLSIIDLSEKSNQPLWDAEQQVCIVFNGEIYNYQGLRESLVQAGYAFNSQGDAEVILNLYLQQGKQCLDALNGIFSFAIWDTRTHELFLARDPFGVKPLYYSQNSQGFYFASEIKSLLVHSSIRRELNCDALLRSIVFLWSPGPETVLSDVHKLVPGHYLIVRDGKITEQRQYYSWPHYSPASITVAQACDQLQNVLSTSVKEQLVADVPVGAFLSGGLDSSLIVAMAKEAGAEALQCFTIDALEPQDRNEGFVEDLPYARKVAEKCGVPLDVLEVKPDAAKLLETMIYHLDEPQADPAPLNVFLICEQARKKGIKVLFSGAGGDDIFTGYRRHMALQAERYWGWLPSTARQLLERVSRRMNKKNPLLRRVSKLFAFASLSNDERLLSYFYWIDPVVVRGLFTKEVQKRLSANPMSALLNELASQPSRSRLEKMLYLERRYFLVDHNFNYTDKMSMAHGVEVRVPFLDKRVIEVASRLHDSIKQKGREGKWILKKMAERYLPQNIIYRSKSGFGAPLQRWLKEDLRPLVEDLLSEASLKKRGLFEPEKVWEMIEKDRLGQEYYAYPIFALLCIELWCRLFIDMDQPHCKITGAGGQLDSTGYQAAVSRDSLVS